MQLLVWGLNLQIHSSFEFKIDTIINLWFKEKWSRQTVGFWKLNADACWNDIQKKDIGWVIRDSSGSPIRAGFSLFERRWPIKA